MHYAEKRKHLERRLLFLQTEVARLDEQFKIAAEEEMKYPAYGAVASYLYAEPAARLREEIKEIEQVLATLPPCEAFVKRFGVELHDLYLEKYPIDRRTQVMKWSGNQNVEYVCYIKPVAVSITWRPEEPGYIHAPTLRAAFEKWGISRVYGGFDYYRLAWCPEINTVYAA